MSSEPSAADLQELSVRQNNEYEQIAGFTLALYDYLITFASEVDSIWRRRLTATSVLHLSTRWSILALFPVQYALPTRSTSTCRAMSLLATALSFVAFVQANAFSALRVYAICGRSWLLGIGLFLIGSVPSAFFLHISVSRSTFSYVPWPIDACTQTLNMPIWEQKILTRVLTGHTIAVHGLTLVLILLKTYSQWRDARQLNIRLSVSTCILRDGVLFFVVALAIDIIKLAVPPTTGDSALLGTMPPLVLINRFLLNLRTLKDTPPDLSLPSGVRQASQSSAVRFQPPCGRSFIGNIGENLSFGEDDAEEEYQAEAFAMEEVGGSSVVENGSAVQRENCEQGSTLSIST